MCDFSTPRKRQKVAATQSEQGEQDEGGASTLQVVQAQAQAPCCDTRFRTHRAVGIERLGV